MKRVIAAIVVIVIAFVLVHVGLRNQQSPERKKNSLMGAWQMVSYKYGSMKEFADRPPQIRRIKIITDTHSVWFEFNADTQETTFGAGGSYSLVGNTYTEETNYWGEGMKEHAGKKHTFKVKIEEDGYIQSGKISSGLDIEEVWRRLK